MDELDSVRTVDRDLVVVSSESVSVGIRVREESSLKHLIGGWLNSWDNVSRREGNLLHLSEVVLDISVQNQLSDWNERVVFMRPDLGDIEDVPLVGGGILLRHDLGKHGPGGGISFLDVVEELSGGEVGINALHLVGLWPGEVLDSGVGLEVPFDVEDLSLLVDPSEGVAAIPVHVTITVRGSSVREENGDLVGTLRGEGEEVPEHVGVLAVGLWVPLLGVDEVWELDWVSDEEDWGVVANHIPVTLLSVELDGEASWVSLSISGALLATNGGEPSNNRSSLSDGVKELGLAVLGDVVGDLEVTMGSGALGVDDSLWDPLSVEVGELIDQMEVLKEDWPILSGGDGVLVVVDWVTLRVGKGWVLTVVVVSSAHFEVNVLFIDYKVICIYTTLNFGGILLAVYRAF